MKPSQRDLRTIEVIKRRLDDPNTYQKEKEYLNDEWMVIGMDYLQELLDEDDIIPSREYGSILVSQADNTADAAFDFGGTALNKAGICLAETFAKSFMRAPDLIVVSPCVLSKQTAEPLISLCSDVTVETWDVGGISLLDLNRQRSESEEQCREATSRYWKVGDVEWKDGVGTESLVEFIQRVDSALSRPQEARDRWTIVFAHHLFKTVAVLRMVEPGVSFDASIVAKLDDAQKLVAPKSHRFDSLSIVALADF
jgi:broad specificity phosphatase PhoE